MLDSSAVKTYSIELREWTRRLASQLRLSGWLTSPDKEKQETLLEKWGVREFSEQVMTAVEHADQKRAMFIGPSVRSWMLTHLNLCARCPSVTAMMC
jgi:hypothetical protein